MGACDVAYGDESIHAQGLHRSTYSLGVCICDFDEAMVRSAFQERRLLRGPKAHWRDMNQRERRRAYQLVAELDMRHVVVSASPLEGRMRPERARRKCLERLLPLLETEYHVSRVVMEARSGKQDKRERAFVQTLRSLGYIDELQLTLQPGFSDARLWLPDQLLGCMGSMGDEASCIQNIDYRCIDL